MGIPKEKAALSGDRSGFSPFLVHLVRLLTNPRPELSKVLARRPRRPRLDRPAQARPRELAKLDAEQRKNLVDLYEAGWAVSRLAKRFSAHGQTVREILLAEGCQVVTGSSRSLSESQITQAATLRRAGLTISDIVRAVGGSESAVRRALKNAAIERGDLAPG